MTHRYVLACSLLCSHVLSAQSGELDSSFAGDGVATLGITAADDEFKALVVQPDGKPVAVGYTAENGDPDLLLARFTSEGMPDNTFGTNGRVVLDVGDIDAFWAVALQADGRIVAAGLTSAVGSGDRVAVARFNADGSADGTFATGGLAALDLGSDSDRAWDLALQADGRIVVTGSTHSGGNDYDPFLVRLTTAGALDASFNGTGILVTDVGTEDGSAVGVAVQPDGRIVQAGYASAGGIYTGYVRRYLADGTVDNGFNGTGVSLLGLAGPALHSSATSVMITADGILVPGYLVAENYDMAVWKFDADGLPDVSFSSDGIAEVGLGAEADLALQVDVLPDGHLVLAGFSANGHPSGAVTVALLHADGSAETGFGDAGHAAFDLVPGGLDNALGLGHDADGRILLAGFLDDGGFDGFVARVLVSGPAGIEEGTSAGAPLKAWPVPAKDHLLLSGAATGMVQLFDAAGGLVRTQRPLGDRRIDLEGLPGGLYTLRAMTPLGEPLGTVRFVKE